MAIYLVIIVTVAGVLRIYNRPAAQNVEGVSEEDPEVTITADGVSCYYPSQHKTEKISWKDMNMIDILTTNKGPQQGDVFIMLEESREKGVAIPQTNIKSKEITDSITKLPGFDHRTFIKAMGSTEYKWFRVWERK